MRSKFAVICDTILAAVCAFLLAFTLVRYYTKNALIALISGIVWGVTLGIAAYLYIRSRQRKKFLFGKEAEEKISLAMHLCLLEKSEAYALVAAAVGGVINGNKIESGGESYFPVFKAEPCSTDDILPAIREKNNGGNKVIVCNYITENARAFAENCGVKVCDCAELYKKLKKAGALPESYLYTKPSKVKLFKRIRSRFTRKLCLPSFWSGAALIFMSWFTFYPVYYIVSGGILLAVCAAAAIFGQPKSI